MTRQARTTETTGTRDEVPGTSDGAAVENEIQRLSSDLAEPSPSSAGPAPEATAKPRLLDSPWLAVVLMIITMAMTAVNVFGPGLVPPSSKSGPVHPAPSIRVQNTLLFAVEEIEAFRREHGRLPSTATELGHFDEHGVEIATIGDDSYTLTVTIDGETMSFSSEQDPRRVFGDQWDERLEK